MIKQEIEDRIKKVNLQWQNGKITLLRREQRLLTLNRLLEKANKINNHERK